MVAVRVLGAIDVVRGGERASVGGVVAKGVLSVMLVRGGLTVSADRLVDEVWREDAKPSTKHTLQSHISNLRKILGHSSIIGEGGGYRINRETVDVDVSEFERLSRQGGERLRLADAEGAAEQLTAALDVWRGPAYVDVEHLDAVRQEIERLEELHVHTEETRARARAELDPDAALPELRALFEQHPDRESLAALLMVTLYRAGRQSEALAAFHELRIRLREARGIDPCPALQELEIAILNQDPTLGRPVGTLRTNLDRAQHSLIGRDAELRSALSRLRAQEHVALTGPGGVGKTAIARTVAAELIDEFAGGVWWVDLESVTEPGLALQTIAAAMGTPVDGHIRASLERRFEAMSSLLVLDGVEPPRNIDPATADWLWAQPVTVLATARTPLAGVPVSEVRPLPVPRSGSDPETMASLAAVSLFIQRAGAVRPGYDLRADPQLLADAVAATGGVPLEIELAAARLRTTDLATLAGRSLGDPPSPTGDLTGPARDALILLSGIPGMFGIGVARALLGPSGVASIQRLDDAGLIHIIPAPAGPAQYRIVDSIRLAASGLLDAEPHRSIFDERIIAWAVGNDQAGHAPETEQPACRAAMSRAMQLGRWDDMMRILQLVVPVWMNLPGWLGEALVWLRRAVSAPVDGSEALVELHLLHARVAQRCGEYAEAIDAASHAHAMAERHDLEGPQARALIELGHGHQFAGEDARAEFEAARAIAASVGDLPAVARANLLLAQSSLLDGTSDSATGRLLADAADAFRDASDASSAAHALAMLAAHAHLAGRPDEAAELADEAVDLAERGSDRSIEILSLYRLASIEERRGRLSHSRRVARRGLRAALEVGHRALVAELLLVFAALDLDESNPAGARRALAAHHAINTELGLAANDLDRVFHLERLNRELGHDIQDGVDAFAIARSLSL